METGLEEQKHQEGKSEQERGGRGAQPPSAPSPIEVFFEHHRSDELSVWMPKHHAATTACFARLFFLREEHMRMHGRPEAQNGLEIIET